MKAVNNWSLISLLFSLAGSSFAKVPLSNVPKGNSAPIVPNRFIVEVDSASDIPSKRSETLHERVYGSLRKRGIRFKVDKQFDVQGLFTGASITLEDPSDFTQVVDTAGVVAVRPVVIIPPPKPVSVHVVTGPNDPAIPPDSESTHILTGVDKLHAQGILGAGIKIGIIDTGVDYTHPTLGGGIGPGHKIIGGFDFVGDAYDGTNTPVPDPDPLDQCNGHGTHVSGIIGADPGNAFNISGVAYAASLSMYRVFGCTGSVTDDVLVEALLRGVTDGQDILTMSLGGASGWTESTAGVLSSRIAATGKVVTIAAGNDGQFGGFYTSSPGNGINAISVASLDNTVVPIQNATVSGATHDPIPYFNTFPLPVQGALPIFATSTDTTVVDDACNPLPDSTPDLSNFLVIIRRGTCTFVQKLTNAAAKGAKVALIYDNGNGFSAIAVGNFTASLIQAQDGVFLVNQFASGANITVSFPQVGGLFNFPNPAGGLISSFTSFGPSNDMFFKPAVAAPGGSILSTLPIPLGSFGIESGTSMATPFMAGSAALLFSVKGRSPSVGTTARTLFETTAQRVASTHTDGDPLQTVAQQGAGLVNVFNAIHTTTIVSPGEFLLNDTANFKGTQSFTIKNTGNTVKTFNITHVPAGTAITFTDPIFPNDGPVPLTNDAAKVTFSANRVTVRPGQTQQVTAHITPPAGVNPATLPVFSGFIEITSPDESLHVTYLGLASALKDKQVVDNTDQFFGVQIPLLLDSQGNIQTDATNYTFVNNDFPTLLTRLSFGTALLRADLVDPNIKIATTLTKRDVPTTDARGGSFGAVPIVGEVIEFDFIPRNSDAADAADNGFNTFAFPGGTFVNGTTIPNGSFRLLLRVLKVTGDRTNENDFESWLSPIIGVIKPN